MLAINAYAITGTGAAGDPYKIATAQDLIDFKAKTNVINAYAELVSDINMTGVTWSPIETFAGAFDGKNFQISNLTLGSVTTPISLNAYGAIFQKITGAIVKNLKIDNFKLYYKSTTYSYWGLIVGIAEKSGTIKPTIDNCHITNSSLRVVSTAFSYFIGPICGRLESGTIMNCSANVATVITSELIPPSTDVSNYVGGLVGQNEIFTGAGDDIKVVNCYSNGSISCSSNSQVTFYIGGIVSQVAKGFIENCYSACTIAVGPSKGGMLVGGIAAEPSKNIINCIALNPTIKGYTTSWLNVRRIGGGFEDITVGPNYAADNVLVYASQTNADGTPIKVSIGTTTNANGYNLGTTKPATILNTYVSNNPNKGYMQWEVKTGVNSGNPVLINSYTALNDIYSHQSRIKVYSRNSSLTIQGLEMGEEVFIFNLLGSVVWKGITQSTEVNITLPKGIYGVKGFNKMIINN